MAVVIQSRRGTAAEWTAANPTLAQGELAVERDTYKIKIGDGVTAWNALAYFGGGSPLTTRGDLYTRGAAADARLPIGAANAVLGTDGTDPIWRTVAAVLDALLTTRGDVLRRGATTSERVALGAAGSIVGSDGTDALWRTLAAELATMLTTRGDTFSRDASTVVRLALGAANTVFGSDGTDALWRTVATVLGALATTRGDLITRDGTGVVRKALGGADRVLQSDGTDVQWGPIIRSVIDYAPGTSIAAGGQANITITWPTAFADASYGAFLTARQNSNNQPPSIKLTSKAAASAVFVVWNNHSVAQTFTFDAIGIHA